MEPLLKKFFVPMALMATLVHFCGLNLWLMEPDAALYAHIARTMAESGDFVSLYKAGQDWLDKPHLPFWLAALSFKLLGVNHVAYRLPALLCFFLGVLYTYRLARLVGTTTSAQLAVLLLLTAEHTLFSNYDVRAEPYLNGFVIASIYYSIRLLNTRWFWPTCWAGLFAGLAMMTKGLTGILPMAGGIVCYELCCGKRPILAYMRYGWLLLCIACTITPELYCLYQQFDLHPEKWIFGQQGISGVRFFFLDSQWGRFFNTGPIRGKGYLGFYAWTIAWAFMPWTPWLVASLWRLRHRSWRWPAPTPMIHVVGAAGTFFVVLSCSKFQLPHYLNIVFALLSIVCAHTLLQEPPLARMGRALVWLQGFFLIAMSCGIVLFRSSIAAICLAAVVFALLLRYRSIFITSTSRSLFVFSFATILLFQVSLTCVGLPYYLTFQAGSQVAQYVTTLTPRALGFYGINSYALRFYAPSAPQDWDLTQIQQQAANQSVYVYTALHKLPELIEANLAVKPLRTFTNLPVTRFRFDFLREEKRNALAEETVLVEITGLKPTGGFGEDFHEM